MDDGKDGMMIPKLIGVILVIAGCGGVGFRMAANHRQEERALRQLVGILDFMECELQYRLTPLPELCRLAAKEFSGKPGAIFLELALEMEAQILPDMTRCMEVALARNRELPPITRDSLKLLGKTIGRFDLEGQLKGLEAVRQDCRRNLEQLCANRETRLRSYRTLGLCAGAALAILFV